jgi:filamentous hemagglutinin
MRKATSETAGRADEGQDRKIAQPGEPAEQEADAVADHIADKLHGDSDKAGASKTMWKGKGKERIDVENPNPG